MKIPFFLTAISCMALAGCMGNKSARSNTPSTYQVGAALDTANEQTLLVQQSLATGSAALQGVRRGLEDSRTLSQRIDDKAVVVLKHWK